MSFGDFNEYAQFMAWRLRSGGAPLSEQQQLELEQSPDMWVQRCPNCNKRATPGRGSKRRAERCCADKGES